MNVKLFLSVRAKCVQMLCLGLWVILFRRCKEVAMSTVGGGQIHYFSKMKVALTKYLLIFVMFLADLSFGLFLDAVPRNAVPVDHKDLPTSPV